MLIIVITCNYITMHCKGSNINNEVRLLVSMLKKPISQSSFGFLRRQAVVDHEDVVSIVKVIALAHGELDGLGDEPTQNDGHSAHTRCRAAVLTLCGLRGSRRLEKPNS